jgi:molybdopterin-containing oxidoreductase family iron-sulfur binding subunit
MNAGPPTKKLWRSLDELRGAPLWRQNVRDEFLPGASEFNHFDRRRFLKLIGASVALAGIPACTRQPIEKIVPYVHQPEQLVPGKPLYFATAMTLGGFATGLLVESHEGHPTKIEGNPGHPANLGATSVFHQAALLDLYDPDRSKTILQQGEPKTWNDFLAALKISLQKEQASAGSGLRILTETFTSPTLHFQIQSLLKRFPRATWHQYEPANRDHVKAGAELAFGEAVETHYHFDRAKVIVSLDADFLYGHPDSLRYARDFASQRRASFDRREMSRLYVVESAISVTGANADHRLPLAWSEIQDFALALAQRLKAIPNAARQPMPPAREQWIAAVAQDLLQHRGESIVIPGEQQPPIVHALAHLLNQFLANAGSTVTFAPSAEAHPVEQLASLRDLNDALIKGTVETLVLLGGNPVFNAPADFDFSSALARARFKIHLSPDVNETSRLCDWHIPENHFLESWSDARSFDGTISIVQPLILPLYGGKSAHELLESMMVTTQRTDYDIVHDYWRMRNPGTDFDSHWQRALHDGWVENSALPAKNVALRSFDIPAPSAAKATDLEITFHPDATILDGRYSNNGWLQELPKPITKLVWDNAAYVSPSLAGRERLANGEVIEIAAQGRAIKAPVWIVPGQPENTIGLQFGNGRTSVGAVGKRAGVNVYPLRGSSALWAVAPISIRKTGEHRELVTTQLQHVIDSEERQIIREGTFSEFLAHPDFVRADSESPSETLFAPDEFKYDGYRWGMAIDLSACIGCSACVLACQSENNIPVVGKTEVSRGRIMHWIRVDSYFRGSPDKPEITHQPVPCMHCENAPCELVCPVGATLHDKEGLNVQVYNRCVGTRYCSNNCPYKVRRFNFFQYADYDTPSLVPMRNPNVTVRWRGVMEKCTYCIQRISAARIASEEQGRKIADGELRTACQQACPAQAIVFGNLGDAASAVSKIKSHPLNFAMLGQLNTRPRTTYLGKLRNPNPALAA